MPTKIDFVEYLRAKASPHPQTVTAAGLAVIANDTGRVLMLQRPLSDDDPAAGKWEFPGGNLNPGETPVKAAIREWTEETGHKLPPGMFTGDWTSPNGVYRGHVYRINSEDLLELNLDHEDRHTLNPDDPDGDEIEVIAWWDPNDLPTNPALRDEVRDGTDWQLLRSTQRHELSNNCHDPETGEFCGDGASESERYFGDYKMEYIKPDHATGLHQIITTLGDTQVAQMSWSTKQIEGLDVQDDHQRKGIARAMFKWGQTMRPRPKHSNDRTQQGDLWAKAMGGKLPRRLPEPPPFEYSAATQHELANDCHSPSDGRFCETGTGTGTGRQREYLEASAEPFSNSCHSPDSGKFCETEGGGTSAPDWPGILDQVSGIRPGSYAEMMKKAYAKKSFEEMTTLSLDYWRKSFMNSSNMRTYLDGKPMAPAYEDGDPWPKFAALTLQEALHTAKPTTTDTWRLEAGSPAEGQTLNWSIKAVATERREAEGYRSSLLSPEATMYRVPKGTKAVYYPDGREAIVQGRFKVLSIQDGVAELAHADATTAAATNEFSRGSVEELANDCHAPDSGRFCETGKASTDFPADDATRKNPRATAWWREASSEFQNWLTPQQRRSVEDYGSSDENHWINGVARGKKTDPWGKPLTAKQIQKFKQDVENLDSAISNAAPFEKPVVTYRGIRLPKYFSQADADQWVQENYRPGKTADTALGGFQSTSFKIEAPLGVSGASDTHQGIVFEIKGRHGVALGNHPFDAEILYARTRKFTVAKVLKDVKFDGYVQQERRTVIQLEEAE